VLLTLLDPNHHGKDSMTVRAFHHSGYGQGQQLNLSEQSIFYDAVSEELPDDAQDESKSKKKEKKRVWLDVYNIDVSILFGQLQVHASVLPLIFPALCQGTINLQKLNANRPSCLKLEEASNVKQDKKSHLSKPGEGASHPKVRNCKLGNCIKGKACRLKDVETMERMEMERRGLFLCHETCRSTGHFRRGVFLYKSSLTRNRDAAKHDFPIGINARDWL
jgi:hypothetical protein